SGLRVSGIGGEVRADAIDVAAVEAYGKGDQFDLILLATKAQDALEVANPGCEDLRHSIVDRLAVQKSQNRMDERYI
ncbi:MAG TPA: hypothetical protein VN948_00730, partial [Terriglobales bacterium]|nr:hypothetical protein [Terriglobales bacterium]